MNEFEIYEQAVKHYGKLNQLIKNLYATSDQPKYENAQS